MRILFLGDVVGRAARDAVIDEVPKLRERLKLDFVIVNAENAAAGIGLTEQIAKTLLAAQVDVITLGDHAFDKKDMLTAVATEPCILRPINIAKTAPGVGVRIYHAPRGKKIAVIQVLGRVFMRQPYDDPFSAVDSALKALALGGNVDAIVLDFHAEATSEKMAMGHWCDGRVSLVVGTHTHVPTADTQILSKGTAFQTDAGMCGDYDSVIGMDKAEPLHRFVTGMAKGRFQPQLGEASLCGVVVETQPDGRAKQVSPLRVGGRLSAIEPAW